VPLVREPGRVDRDTAEPADQVVGGEHLLGIRPQRVEPGLHPPVALLGSVAQPEHPLGRVVDVVGDLLDGLRRDTGERLVRRALQRVVQQMLVRREVQQARDGDGEVAIRPFADQQVREVPLVAVVREIVLGPSAAFQVCRVRQQRPRLPELVEPDVAERDVLLELRGVRDPLAHPLGRDQGVVTEPEGVGEHIVVHRCSTPSGIS
jgi:hypothetical protein